MAALYAGTWLMAVFPAPGNKLVGFVHGEDHFKVIIEKRMHLCVMIELLVHLMPVS